MFNQNLNLFQTQLTEKKLEKATKREQHWGQFFQKVGETQASVTSIQESLQQGEDRAIHLSNSYFEAINTHPMI